MDEAPDLDWLITAFTERVPGVARTAVVSADGLPLACSQGFPGDGLDQMAAITSGLSSLVRGAARIFEAGLVYQTVLIMQHGVLIVRAIGHGAVLAVLASAECDIGEVAHEMVLLGDELGTS